MSNEFINLGSTKNHEDFQLRYISFSKYEGDWQSLPHTHQFSELFYVLRGEGIFYIEDKKVSISRVNGTHTFPSSFMFITAMNPCPCGYYPGAKCKCTDYEIIKYRGKISGPIMDRIDIQKEVHPVDFFAIADQKSGASSEELRTKVEKARKIQQERYAQEKGINCNAQMTTELIQRYCVLDKDSLNLLRETSEKYGYSARVIHKLLRLARTSADLDGEEKIRQKDRKSSDVPGTGQK